MVIINGREYMMRSGGMSGVDEEILRHAPGLCTPDCGMSIASEGGPVGGE